MSNEDTTRIVKMGKYTAVLYPEIYFQFVSKIHREHPDLIGAMTLAKLSIRDKSGIDYLNQILGVNVLREMPMEVAYKILYDALDKRKNTEINNRMIERVAKENFNIATDFTFRSEEHAHKPLFPSIEEQKDRGDK